MVKVGETQRGVGGTQRGVAYQLRSGAENIGPPGYHYEDRRLETTRLEVDFVVGQQGDPLLLLPIDRVTATTTYNVLATKTLTGISVQLTKLVEIKIT
jgi:hypothetical protein